jgi:predicted secreted hydrolase
VSGVLAPVKVWLDDWRLTGPSLPVSVSGVDKSVASDTAQWQLIMASDTESVDLSLSPQKPPVLQGDQGLSVKSDGNCNASYYYSISRLQVSGEITNRGESHSVIGSAWLDREWSSSVLADHQVGWDWFALQLTDGRDLMIYQLRDKAGRPDTHSYAVEIDIAGNKTIIPFRQIQLDIERWWQSP